MPKEVDGCVKPAAGPLVAKPDPAEQGLVKEEVKMIDKLINSIPIVLSLLACVLVFSLCGKMEERWPLTCYVSDVAVCSDITQEEIDVLTATMRTYREFAISTKWAGDIMLPVSQCVFFVRYPEQEIPEICRKRSGCMFESCVDRWVDLPNLFYTPVKLPDHGYGGYCGCEHIFVNRYGQKEKLLIPLVAHEFAHAVSGWADGDPRLKDLTNSVTKRIKEILNE